MGHKEQVKIIVGCPVSNRAWILDRYREHVSRALDGQDFSFLFVVGEKDEETLALLSDWDDTELIISDEPDRSDVRDWNRTRYEEMSILRNSLLKRVRELRPALFLSLDSDILLHEDAFKSALGVMLQYEVDVVGMKVYLMPSGTDVPNYGRWTQRFKREGYMRPDRDSVTRADILMAAKLMNQKAYNINYASHIYGEDLGWSKNANDAGVGMMWDGTVANKHIMLPELLDAVDNRIGW